MQMHSKMQPTLVGNAVPVTLVNDPCEIPKFDSHYVIQRRMPDGKWCDILGMGSEDIALRQFEMEPLYREYEPKPHSRLIFRDSRRVIGILGYKVRMDPVDDDTPADYELAPRFESPKSARILASVIEAGEMADDAMGLTDCPDGCTVESDGWCSHGYASAALTAGVI